MPTQTVDGTQPFTDWPTDTSLDIDRESSVELYQGNPLAASLRSPSALPRWAAYVGRCVLAVSVATTPIGYYDPRQEERRSGASSLEWAVREGRRGQAISFSMARQLALQILEQTEQRLQHERASEAQFLLGLWEDENDL